MAKRMPPISMSLEREPTEKANGLREANFVEPGQRDIGSARTFGPKRAARLWSPTRDVKASRLYRHMV